MIVEDEITRQTNINLQLRRQLEECRRDVVEVCAKFCEDRDAGHNPRVGWSLIPRTEDIGTHAGQAYAAGLRGLIGSHKKVVASE
jgi:hypothetical protein